MPIPFWPRTGKAPSRASRAHRLPARRTTRPQVEALEDRLVPAKFFALNIAGDHLEAIDSAAPGQATAAPIHGLQPGESLVAIADRPVSGTDSREVLCGLSSAQRLYEIDPGPSAATATNSVQLTGLSGSGYSLAFDPTSNLARVVTQDGNNFSVDLATDKATLHTALQFVDTTLSGPSIAAIAYGSGGALYAEDNNQKAVFQLGKPSAGDSPDNGNLYTVGQVGFNHTLNVGFAIDSGGNAYAALENLDASTREILYAVNLNTGHATPVSLNLIGGGTFELSSMAAVSDGLYAQSQPTSTPPPPPPPMPALPPPRPVMGTLIHRRSHGTTRLYVRLSYADTGAVILEVPSPFQGPSYHGVQLLPQEPNGDGVTDFFTLMAQKGKRTVMSVYPA